METKRALALLGVICLVGLFFVLGSAAGYSVYPITHPQPTPTPKAPAFDMVNPLPYLREDLGKRALELSNPEIYDLVDIVQFGNFLIFDFSTTDSNTGYYIIYQWHNGQWEFLRIEKYEYVPNAIRGT